MYYNNKPEQAEMYISTIDSLKVSLSQRCSWSSSVAVPSIVSFHMFIKVFSYVRYSRLPVATL